MAHRWIATAPGGPELFELVDWTPPAPGPGEVTIAVRAAGVNPADHKHVTSGDPADFPQPIGYEVSGVLSAVGPDTRIATGEARVGAEVLAFRVRGGWSTELTVPAADVFAKPPSMTFEAAANLLLAGTTASEMLHRTAVAAGETVLVHGASGAVGVSVLQQASLLGVRVVGTASEASFARVQRFGGVPVAYGAGLADRIREVAPDGIAAALDCIGTDEAVAVSLELVDDRERILTIAAADRARSEGIRAIGGRMPHSKAYRDRARGQLVQWAAEGRLEVPIARTFPLADALAAVDLLRTGHPGGKLALITA
jgi:NADPH:quinone reductase-like Zn-dependent oxidoreductase